MGICPLNMWHFQKSFNFVTPEGAAQNETHVSPWFFWDLVDFPNHLLFLLNLAYGLMILHMLQFQTYKSLLSERKMQLKIKFISGVTFWQNYDPAQFSFGRYGKTVVATDLLLGSILCYHRWNIMWMLQGNWLIGRGQAGAIVLFIWFDPKVN